MKIGVWLTEVELDLRISKVLSNEGHQHLHFGNEEMEREIGRERETMRELASGEGW